MASVYSVTQINSYIKNMFTQDFMLHHLFIKGEVSNCKHHSSGHVYFTLKDGGGTLACVMFASNQRTMDFRLQEGQNVIVEGAVTVYERDGRYQMYAKNITLDGIGQLYRRYEMLKQELEEMGMFAEEYKRPIPRYASRIGIVTAKTGAAIQDILNIAKRRNPYVQLILYPAQVQGEGAKETIVKGIEVLDKMNVDVIIVGRGGGSIEDLWAFNEECVARAIFECQTPVISAVGHEVDVTIADYVADLRAPTPSAAAELAVFDYGACREHLDDCHRWLQRAVTAKAENCRNRLEQCRLRLNYKSPQNQILEKRQRLLDLEEHLSAGMEKKILSYRHRLAILSERLQGLSPLNKLGRGYAYVRFQEKPLLSVKQVKEGELLELHVEDGMLEARVEQIRGIRWEKIQRR